MLRKSPEQMTSREKVMALSTGMISQKIADLLLIDGMEFANQSHMSPYACNIIRTAIAHGADVENAQYKDKSLVGFLLLNDLNIITKLYLLDILAKATGNTDEYINEEWEEHRDAIDLALEGKIYSSKFMRSRGISATVPDESQALTLHKLFMASVYAGDAERARFYLSTYRLDPNRDDFKYDEGIYRTAMHTAAYMEHVNVMKVLKLYGANLKSRDGFMGNRTPLHVAARQGNFAAARWLVGNGADIYALCDNGQTVTQIAGDLWGEPVQNRIATIIKKSFLTPGTVLYNKEFPPLASTAIPAPADGDPNIDVVAGIARTAAMELERGGAAGR